MTLRIVLVRHGLSSFNLEHRIQGRDDLSSLSEEGRLQARRTGEALRDLPFDRAFTSPLRRARDTAIELLAAHGQGLTAQAHEGLLEIDLAPWSGLLRKELAQLHPEQERRWRESPESLILQRSNGQPYNPVAELLQQAGQFWSELLSNQDGGFAARDQTLLVVAHNAILRCLLISLLKLPLSSFRRLRVDNASISVLNLNGNSAEDRAVQIESLNGTTHLGAPIPPGSRGPRLVLVRHGETDWNRQGRFQGQIDIPLNATGRDQAEAAGRFLASITLHRAYSSAMARPRQTAELILACHPGVPLTTTSGLIEIGHGLWEGRLEQDIAESWPGLLADWKRAPETVEMPEGETIHQVWERSLATWSTIAASLGDQEIALVVAHDAVNKVIICALLGLTPADIWTIKQGNGAVTVIDYPRGAHLDPVVSAINLTAHLGGVLDRTAAGAL
ncbi:MAG: histidine phosphatase family protein [Cyanobacteriota bacterium]|nr:histidine phosphatase family protein [Cyanobacteriota bacterium]